MECNEKNISPTCKPSNGDLWRQFGNLVQSRSCTNQVYWGVFAAFWASNALLLVALFERGELPKIPIVSLIISFAGAGLSYTWLALQQRVLRHLQYEEAVIKKLVALLLGPNSPYGLNRKLPSRCPENNYFIPDWPTRDVVRRCTWFALIGWSIGAIYYLMRVFPALLSFE